MEEVKVQNLASQAKHRAAQSVDDIEKAKAEDRARKAKKRAAQSVDVDKREKAYQKGFSKITSPLQIYRIF